MAKKASKKSSKKTTAKTTAKKTTAKKRSTQQTTAPKTAPAPQPITTVVETSMTRPGPKDEHLVLSHMMWILFLFSSGLAAVFTVQFLMEKASSSEYYGVAALVLLGWAFVFKMFAHRMHEQ